METRKPFGYQALEVLSITLESGFCVLYLFSLVAVSTYHLKKTKLSQRDRCNSLILMFLL